MQTKRHPAPDVPARTRKPPAIHDVTHAEAHHAMATPPPGLDPVDEGRAASMADEGGVSAQEVERQEEGTRHEPRVEKDSLGNVEVPGGAYFGAQTVRAIRNFPISGFRPWPEFVDAVVHIKKAAALVHGRLGTLDPARSQAIVTACEEILAGAMRDQFVVDVFQAGAGTSHHMNINEVVANRAIEILHGARGDHTCVHPNDHVNLGQSTNDVIPTAIRMGAVVLSQEVLAAMDVLVASLARRAVAFSGVVKAGRTHLQDAVPVTLGAEFAAYAQVMTDHRRLIAAAVEENRTLGMGGAAVGTGLNTPADWPRLMAEQLSLQLGTTLRQAPNLMAAMQSMSPFAALSSTLRNACMDLLKISNDLRLLGSGPMTGFAEIEFAPLQPGSSIMPGKVNPVLAEMLAMVCFQVAGNDVVIAMASQAGQLELNVMMPVIAFDLFFSLKVLASAVREFASAGVDGITAHTQHCRRHAELSLANVTALTPMLGYGRAAELAMSALREHRSLRELVLEGKLMEPVDLDRALDVEGMARAHG